MKGRKLYLKGFSFIEAILVIGIMGILLVVAYPNIKNSLETRGLENGAREIQTTLQQAKFQAVKFKLNHRVQFDNSQGYWMYYILRETAHDTWVEVPNSIRKSISAKYIININLPDERVDFSPLGLVLNYSFNNNSISLRSTVLQRQGQPSTRSLNIFAGGSIQYVKSS
jgi:type II secretory pathway pseudopilin PulG